MTYPFPPDVQKLISEQMAESGYRSEDEVLRDALQVLRVLKSRQDELLADIGIGIQQADQGLSRPLDVQALIERCSLSWRNRTSLTDVEGSLDACR